MSAIIKIDAQVRTFDVQGNCLSEVNKTFELDIMKIGLARQWVSRAFNKALKAAPKDIQVVGKYAGQNTNPPFQFFGGRIGGTNGRILSRSGEYDQ